jgi:hypothetical protein
MFTLYALVLGLFTLAAFDWYLTMFRIAEYGPEVEYNKLIIWLVSRTTLEVGSFLGVFLPTFLICALSIKFNWVAGPAILFGMRLKAWIGQRQSLIFEKKLKKLREQADDLGSDTKSPPSTLRFGASDPILSEDKC